MRIQHNIMAMDAYRNYTNNLSAMQKNLEKLSSGYKINRAGDDAAGLAISEKMRAQITGLTAAQKNAKDGISLVQTAEGALTEVHDMLNRMVQLATQSANGTYDNETDRDQLQKEMNQLRSEIDRIADASNFNGIKLLDGSMDSDAGLTGVKYTVQDAMKLFVNKDVDGVKQDHPLGGKDIMEKDSGETGPGSFEIDLDGIGELDIAEGQKFVITVGDATIESDELTAGKYDSKKLAEELDGKEITINAGGKDRVFTAKADGGKLTFTTADGEDFKLNANDKVGWKVLKAETPEPDFEPAAVEGTLEATTSTALDGSGPTAAQYTSTVTIANADKLVEGNQITIGGDTYTIVDGNVHAIRGDEVDLNEINTEEGLKKFIAEKLNDAETDYDVSVNEDGDLVYVAYQPGQIGGTGPAAPSSTTAPTITIAQGNAATFDNTISASVSAATQDDAGEDAVSSTKFIKLSDADNDAIAAAAQELGAADGAKLTIKVDSTNNKAQLFAGDKKISEVDYTADGNTSTTVTFKDEAGNALLKASLVKVEGDEDAFGTDGFDTGLTFKAQVGTPDGAGGAAGSSEDGLMALDEAGDAGTTTGTPASIGGTASATVGINEQAATQGKISIAVELKDSGNSGVTLADGESFTISNTADTSTSGKTEINVTVTYHSADGGSWEVTGAPDGFTGTFDGSDLVLTKTEAGATSLVAGTLALTSTNNSVDDSNSSVAATSTDGTDVVAATKTFDASGLDKDAILAALGSNTPDNGAKVTIEMDSNNKLLLKVGNTTVGTSVESVPTSAAGNATTITFTADGNAASDSNASLGTISLPDGVIDTDFTAGTALETGLTYTAATSGSDDPGPVGPGEEVPEGSQKVIELNDPAFDALDALEKNTSLDATQVTAIKDALDTLGGGSGKITLPEAGNVEVDLSGVTDGATTAGQIAENIMNAAKAAIDEYNKTAETKYEVVGVSSDAEGTNWLAGGTDAASLALPSGTGFYIHTKTAAPTDVDDGTVEVAGGTINSGLQNVKDNVTGSSDQLAHVVVDFDKAGAWSDGAKITIGDTDYTVAVGKDSKFKNAANVIDLTDMEAGNIKKDVAAQRLTVAANANKTFVVGHDGTGKTVLKQRSGVKVDTEMETQEKIAKYLGVSTADPDSVKAATVGKGLKLQIGDTAEGFNQLTVQIKDMHAEALGLNDIQISDQESAAKAIDVIKDAINSVSDLRGTLGATQNRLDHTINNLSVMTENITDAESTIRDTDVAEEMMAYTKNNILIQSAQAMLAQANQVPQGVLQLLQ